MNWTRLNPFRRRPAVGLMITDSGPLDRAEAAGVAATAAAIGHGVDDQDFGAFFLARHPQFAEFGFPPIGWDSASEVHEAIFDTLSAYARHVIAEMSGGKGE